MGMLRERMSGNRRSDSDEIHATHLEDAHDSNHSHEHDDDASEAFVDALMNARGGLRSLVQAVVDHLDEGALFLPLSEDIAGAPEGQELPLDGELSFRPHMVLDPDEKPYAVAFTDPSLAEEIEAALGWQTSGEELKFVRLPARAVLEIALEQVDGIPVEGLVIDPSTESELTLSRDEVQSISAGKAIPLVGYIEELPEGEEDGTQIVEGADPPPKALLDALDHAKKKLHHLVGYRVDTTFNPERDREPHLTITLHLRSPDSPRGALADDVMELIAPHLPPPSYADIVFRDAPN
jgi:SseB protein N-terminal domain